MKLNILFENPELLAIDKPAGLLSHAGPDRARPDALRLLTQKSDQPLFLLHRLDVGTSGVLLFAKSTQAQEKMTAFFRDRLMHKTYLGITDRKPRQSKWRVENHLALEKTSASKAPRSIAVKSGGQKATTDFEVLHRQARWTLIQAHPLTGRRHQIRTHLADSGCPLAGDPLYGGSGGPRLFLHAWKLAWEDQGQLFQVEAPCPTGFPLQPPRHSVENDEF